MSEAAISLIKGMYESFGRGDIDGVIAGLTCDIHWRVNGERSDYPLLGVWNGTAEVKQFFAGVAELADDGDHLLRLAITQGSRRLVEEDDAAVLLHGARDGDALALAAGKNPDRHPDRGNPHLQRRERIGGAVDHGAAVGEEARLAERAAEIHVGRDVEALDQGKVLEDDGDAELTRLGGTGESDRTAIDA